MRAQKFSKREVFEIRLEQLCLFVCLFFIYVLIYLLIDLFSVCLYSFISGVYSSKVGELSSELF